MSDLITGQHSDDYIRVELRRVAGRVFSNNRNEGAQELLDWILVGANEENRLRRYAAVKQAYIDQIMDHPEAGTTPSWLIRDAEIMLPFLSGETL